MILNTYVMTFDVMALEHLRNDLSSLITFVYNIQILLGFYFHSNSLLPKIISIVASSILRLGYNSSYLPINWHQCVVVNTFEANEQFHC